MQSHTWLKIFFLFICGYWITLPTFADTTAKSVALEAFGYRYTLRVPVQSESPTTIEEIYDLNRLQISNIYSQPFREFFQQRGFDRWGRLMFFAESLKDIEILSDGSFQTFYHLLRSGRGSRLSVLILVMTYAEEIAGIPCKLLRSNTGQYFLTVEVKELLKHNGRYMLYPEGVDNVRYLAQIRADRVVLLWSNKGEPNS